MPKRYLLVILMFFGLFNCLALRVNLSVAIVAMTNGSEVLHVTDLDDLDGLACRELVLKPQNESYTENTFQDKENIESWKSDWDIRTQSFILGSFYYGYLAFQIPGAFVVERYGAKWPFGLGILVSSILTMLTPLAAAWGVIPLVLVRVIEGLVQGAIYPSVSVLIARWVPKVERTRSFSIVYIGATVGTMSGMLLSGILADISQLGGWPSIFYVFGALGCCWFVFWAILVYETPASHPGISEAELDYISKDQAEKNIKDSNVPWLLILKSVPVWCVNIAVFGYLWALITLTSEMPTYFYNILHLDIAANGALSAMPYILQGTAGLASSYIADKMREANKFSITTIRKLMNSIAAFGSGICFMVLFFVGCRRVLSIVIIGFAMALHGFSHSGCGVTMVDLSPSHTGTLTAIANTCGNIAGFLAPYVAGELTSSGQTVDNWNYVFITVSAISFFAGIIFDVFGTAEEQPWNSSETLSLRTMSGNQSISKAKLETTTVIVKTKKTSTE